MSMIDGRMKGKRVSGEWSFVLAPPLPTWGAISLWKLKIGRTCQVPPCLEAGRDEVMEWVQGTEGPLLFSLLSICSVSSGCLGASPVSTPAQQGRVTLSWRQETTGLLGGPPGDMFKRSPAPTMARATHSDVVCIDVVTLLLALCPAKTDAALGI